LDDLIIQMIETPKPVIFDCRVHKLANCFPMIPSGAGHHEMLLADDFVDDDIEYVVSEEGKVMV
jgi:acetolactate synthase-1/2/3 large subunit